ncbi:hypothetical protein VB779_12420 [Haloarculaceae archaeon H-GB11]|nr:hypothetical protein [Haloarculaceae archaeon H-GB11]
MSSDEIEAEVISPNVSIEEAIVTVDPGEEFGPDSVRVVGHPKYLFDYVVRLERLFFSDRVESLSVTIDGINGGGLRNDAYPDIERRRLPEDALFSPQLDRDEAEDKARSVLRRYLNVQFATFIIIGKTPDIELVQEDLAYVLYWLVPDDQYMTATQTVSVVDSVTGRVLESNQPLESVTGELFDW